jgi:RNA polymerase sigma-70 factor (ECF subfamily)
VLAQPDADLLRRAQRGDQTAFSALVVAYQAIVFNYVLRLVGGDRCLAEDMTQEVFLRVHQSLPSFSARAKFTTWLFQVTKNRVVDEFRARERRPRCVELVALHEPAVEELPIERWETTSALWQAVGRLNVDLRMALLLREVVGLSYDEIAEALEITLATVKWRIYKAREDVQVMLAGDGIVLDSGSAAPPDVEAATA